MYDVVVDKVKTTDKAAAREIFRQHNHNIAEPPAPAGAPTKLGPSHYVDLMPIVFDPKAIEDGSVTAVEAKGIYGLKFSEIFMGILCRRSWKISGRKIEAKLEPIR